MPRTLYRVKKPPVRRPFYERESAATRARISSLSNLLYLDVLLTVKDVSANPLTRRSTLFPILQKTQRRFVAATFAVL